MSLRSSFRINVQAAEHLGNKDSLIGIKLLPAAILDDVSPAGRRSLTVFEDRAKRDLRPNIPFARPAARMRGFVLFPYGCGSHIE
jgi:hypothetical protein